MSFIGWLIAVNLEFGPVASVNVPRRVLDGPETQRNVYAFVVMKTLDGAKNAFAACRKVSFFMHFVSRTVHPSYLSELPLCSVAQPEFWNWIECFREHSRHWLRILEIVVWLSLNQRHI